MIVYDTETCGLHGPIILIQYWDDGEIRLHNVWLTPIKETLNLIEWLMEQGTIGFNLAFDHFHLCQTYTTLLLLQESVGPDALPNDHIDTYAICEERGRDGPCLKPTLCCDLMLYARKGPYQSTMERRNIVVKRVPNVLVKSLQKLLEDAVKLDDIYFARRKERKEMNWDIDPCDDTEFANLTLRFKPSAALKVLAQDALGYTDPLFMRDVTPGNYPLEKGWAPFALALSSAERGWRVSLKTATGRKKGYAWPGVIRHHISHWEYHKFARQYAADDVKYTLELCTHFEKNSDFCINDNDSILACQIGASRWRGYKINIEGIKELRVGAIERSNRAPKAPGRVLEYLTPHLSEAELAVMDGSTARPVLEYLADLIDHPAAPLAKDVLESRKAKKEVELWDKLLEAGRFHASLKVIGTLSSRMSGADGLNPQGIKHDKYVRKQFPLASGDLVLCGGDFMAFEVSIIDAICEDPKLREELCRCSRCKNIWPLDKYATQIECPHCGESDDGEPCRQKFAGLFAMGLDPGINYDDVMASKGTDDDMYDKGKRGGFSQFYGGNWNTLVTRLGVDDETAQECERWFNETFKGSAKFKDEIHDDFCSMKQPAGIGTQVIWDEPKEYIESLMGFRRYFTIENRICKTLYRLATKLPPTWKQIKLRCMRRDREQTVAGAVMSALYASAFAIQAKNMRAAANHRIQSTGATITKELQCRLWDLQPPGIGPWKIQPLNIHDEVMCPISPELQPAARQIVDQLIKDMQPLVPLIAISWGDNLKSWADK